MNNIIYRIESLSCRSKYIYKKNQYIHKENWSINIIELRIETLNFGFSQLNIFFSIDRKIDYLFVFFIFRIFKCAAYVFQYSVNVRKSNMIFFFFYFPVFFFPEF